MEQMHLCNMDCIIEAGYCSGDRQGCLRGTRRSSLSQLRGLPEDKQG